MLSLSKFNREKSKIMPFYEFSLAIVSMRMAIASDKPAQIFSGTALFCRCTALTDPLSRRFREGISFPTFVEGSILKVPLSKICAVPFALQNRAFFEGENTAKRCPEKRGKRGGKQRGMAQRKEGRVTTGQLRLGAARKLLHSDGRRPGWSRRCGRGPIECPTTTMEC